MDNRDAVCVLADETGCIACSDVAPAGVELGHQVVVRDGVKHYVIAPLSVCHLDELEIVVVIQESHACVVDLLAYFVQHGKELLEAFRIDRAILFCHIRHYQELHADLLVICDDGVEIFHHLSKCNVCTDRNKADLVQHFFDILRSKAIQTSQLNAVIAQILYLLHYVLKVLRSVLKEISEAVNLNTNRKLFTHFGFLPFYIIMISRYSRGCLTDAVQLFLRCSFLLFFVSVYIVSISSVSFFSEVLV